MSSGGGGESGLIYSGVNAAINAFVPGGNLGTDRPAAYLNYILFDENYNLLGMGWQPAPDVTFSKQKLSFNTINVKQEGFLFAYLSYDNDSNNWVYFDDFKVTHTPTNVLQYNEYYPFGLQTSNSWTRENSSNDYLYNAGNELNGNSGWYETFFRGYDPVLGRFTQADPLAYASSSHTPYNYAFNDPVYYNDPMGDYPPTVYIDRYENGTGGGSDYDGMFGGQGESSPWYRVDYGSWIPSGGGSTMVAGSFVNSALNSFYGGTWSSGGSYSFYNSDEEAFGAGVDYLDATNGWGGTEGDSVAAARQSFYGIHDKYVFRWGSKGGFKTVKYLGLNEGYQAQGEAFNLVDGIVKINGITSTYLQYNTGTSAGTLVQALPGGAGVAVYDFDYKTNLTGNVRYLNSIDLGLGDRFDKNDGWKIPNWLAKAYAGDEFREAFGANTDAFWRLLSMGKGGIYYMGSGTGIYNNQEYNVSTYRFTGTYSIFVGQNRPSIQVGLYFDVNQYSPR